MCTGGLLVENNTVVCVAVVCVAVVCVAVVSEIQRAGMPKRPTHVQKRPTYMRIPWLV